MIWRGKQYARGVKLYYRRMGRFPTNLDDLTKPKLGSLRFMRQAYKDPMNKEDGAWRFIYVGPGGQLIGSLKPPQQNLLFPQGAAPNVGTPASALNGSNSSPQPGSNGQPGATGGLQPGGSGGFGASSSTTNPPAATGTPVSADQGSPDSSQSIPAGDTPTIVGGNIIGVGSKINKPSIAIYDKATNYRLFEFIWDPSKDYGAGRPGGQPGSGLGGQGVQPQGLNPGNPPQSPQTGQTPQNPPQNQAPQNPQQ